MKIQVWDANSGAPIRTAFTFTDGILIGSAWLSPNGKYLALQKSDFQDPNTFEGSIDGLAWSPNGKYLAESSAEIHIWNIATGQLVATFGKFATKTTSSTGTATTFSQIVSVSWASDGRRLASVTASITNPPVSGSKQQNILHVWQLS